jgi:hypothetical protein
MRGMKFLAQMVLWAVFGAAFAVVFFGTPEHQDGRVLVTEHDMDTGETKFAVALEDGRRVVVAIRSERAFDKWVAQPGNRVLVSRWHRVWRGPTDWEVE